MVGNMVNFPLNEWVDETTEFLNHAFSLSDVPNKVKNAGAWSQG
jgi:hypothetical protein